jgi:hypothetical protein
VNLFGTDIPKENISARIEQGFIKIEFKLPDDLDPEAPKSTVYIPGTKSKGLGDCHILCCLAARQTSASWLGYMPGLKSAIDRVNCVLQGMAERWSVAQSVI